MENLNLNELNDVFGGAHVSAFSAHPQGYGYVIKVHSDGNILERSAYSEAKSKLLSTICAPTGNFINDWVIKSVYYKKTGTFAFSYDITYIAYHKSQAGNAQLLEKFAGKICR